MVSTGFGLGISHQHSHPVSNSAPQGSLAIRKNSILQWCTGGQVEITIYIQNSPIPYWLILLPSSYLYDNTGILQCVSIHVGTINSQPWMIQLLPAKKPWHKTPSHAVIWSLVMLPWWNIAYQFFQAKTDHEYSWCSKASSFAASERNENSS